ncbi:MAG: hypothetical protein SFU83_23760 [Meiothermus sp.]|nr:hypothetical protein [Meiothermus sp.]
MKIVVRWAVVYLGLMVVLTAFGYYNQQRQWQLEGLQKREAELARTATRLTLQRYDLLSPLALREWAERNGYVPMSLANWQRTAP